ncbi:hypothetical protein MUP77_05065 [Candidatus Bathyarchaeota archaeon]|nr:hypothetical protein [Candidatus Bathyarchaeota archaeon]
MKLRQEELAWLAGIIDGEGTIGASFEKPKGYASTYLVLYVRVSNTKKEIVEECKRISQVGNIQFVKAKNSRWNDWYFWTAKCHNAVKILKELEPYILTKKRHIELAYEWVELERFVGYHKKGSIALSTKAIEKRKGINEHFHKLNIRGRIAESEVH